VPSPACLDDAALVALAAGGGDAGVRASALRHADACDACRELLAALTGTPDGTRGAEPERIGRYQLQRQLGEGAMGAVYLAFDPDLQREIALKLVTARAVDDDAGAVADAERVHDLRTRLTEARAMAQVEHPAVVRVYDAGVVGGELYVAMELLPGPTLGAWLADGPRTEADVVAALAALGEGLAAAHAAGIVHRDFKPSNAMRDRAGGWKVTDFGLAAIDAGDRAGLAGTPAYMAPEQRTGAPVDGRADQYAWAVTLHEALTGVRPGRAGVDGVAVPRHLANVLAIASAANPGERFADMATAVAALRAAHARPRRRRRALAAAVGGTVAALGLSAVALAATSRPGAPPPCTGAPTELARAWRADAALRARPDDTSARTVATLDAYARAWRDEHVAACRATAIDQTQSPALLDARMACLEQRLAELGEVAALADAAATPPDAARGLSSALALTPLATCAASPSLRARAPAPSDPATAARLAAVTTTLGRARAIQRDGRHADVVALLAPELPSATALGHAPTLAELEFVLAGSEEGLGQFEAATTRYRAAARHAAEGRDDAVEVAAWLGLAYVVGFRQQRPAEADAWLTAADAAVTRAGATPRLAGQLAMTRGTLAMMRGSPDEGRRHYRDALALLEGALPVGDLRLAPVLTNLGIAEQRAGDLRAAEATLTRAMSLRVAHLGDGHPDVASAALALAQLHLERGEPAAARPLVEQALAIRQATLGQDHVDLAPVLTTLGSVQRQLARLDDARAAQARALAIWERVHGPVHPNVALALGNLAGVEVTAARPQAAVALYRRALAIHRAQPAPTPSLAHVLFNLGEALRQGGQLAEAEAAYAEALALRTQLLGADHMELAFPLIGLGHCDLARGDRDAARARFERALALRDAAGVVGHDAAVARFALAVALAPRDQARARALVTAARALVRDDDDLAGELDAWTRAHPEPPR
jgi:tetratricopeptide (TPR) repeat protein